MINIDRKNKKILYELDLNARRSGSYIGKKVGLHRNVVEYRIKRLKETGIIKNFYTIIDTSKLGYISLRCYLKFQNINLEVKQKIINDFVENKHTFWVSLKKYHKFIQDQIFSVYIKLLHYPLSYLTNEKINRNKSEIIGGGTQIPIDEIELNILRILSINARMPLIEIARKLNTTSMVIKHRIKKMRRQGVIQGFRTNLDFTKLGYKHFKVDIYLMAYEKAGDITNYLLSNPHLVYIDYTAGFSDLELEFHLKGSDELHRIMDDVISRFPNTIKNYSYFIFSEIHKMRYMPE